MKKYFLSFFTTAIIACSGKIQDRNIEITIEDAQSYRYDLKNETFVIYFDTKPPLEIKFTLSNEERLSITEKYYSLDLDELPPKLIIEDECHSMPKLYKSLAVKTRNKSQKIKIDLGCDDFNLSNLKKADRIKQFILFILHILEVKPQIQNAPKSDIWYI